MDNDYLRLLAENNKLKIENDKLWKIVELVRATSNTPELEKMIKEIISRYLNKTEIS